MKTKTQLTNRILSLVLTVVMVLGMLPLSNFTALAADASGDSVTIDLSTVTQDILLGENHTYSLDGGVTYTEYVGKLTFAGTTSYSIIVNSYASIHDIVLDNVSMSNETRNKGNIMVSEAASLNLTFKGTNTLTQTGGMQTNSSPAINLLSGATLTITEESTGILNAKGGAYCAAIGGTHCFTVIINGGTINAGANYYGGGIGYGNTSSDSDPTTIIINNAVVNASGKGRNAAIGGGYGLIGGASVNILITNSTVTAVAGSGDVAAIGAGKNDSNTYNITIKNSVVNAETSGIAAAIGSSGTGTAGDIEIIDSVVTATAGWKAAGIGGGPENNVGNILIQNSTVTATGGKLAAGIGGGYENTVLENDKVTIIGSNVCASGDSGVRTIGSGYEGAGFPIGNAGSSNIALTKITLQGVSRDVKVTEISTATGYEDVDIMTIGGVLYIWLPDGDSPTEVIANGQKYVGTVTDKVGTFVFEHTCEVGENGTPASCGKYAICGLCNQDFGEMASHNFKYSATDNVVTETCSNNCGHNETATLTASDANYTGSAIATATVTYSDGWRGSKEHGEIAYTNNLKAGKATAKVKVEGKELTTNFQINAADVSGATVTLNPTSGTYDGTEQKPTVSVTWNNMPLTENTDYTLSWDKVGFTNADAYTVTVTGTGNFEGTKNAAFSINPVDIKDAVVTLDQDAFVYDGQPHKPTAIVTFNGATLTEGVDYEVYYLGANQIMKWENGEPVKFFGTGKESCDSINAGQYFAVVFGKGNFADNGRFAYAAYTIEKATVTEPTIESKTYDNTVQTADVPASDLFIVGENNGGIDAGNYDVVLKLTDSTNYKWATSDNAEITLQFKIIQARNAWITAPAISGWTYGETANAPTGEAKFGTVYVLYDGITNDGTTYDSDTPPTKAGSYVARFFVDDTANYEPIAGSVPFTIAKANQAAPTGIGKEDETIFKKADGKITGVDSTMEYRAENENTYTAITGSAMENLAAGKYYVRVKGDSNHVSSPDVEVTVAAGRMLTVTLPQTQVGYTLTVDKTEFAYNDSLHFTFILHDGYTMTDDFSAKFNDMVLPVHNGDVVVDSCIEDVVVTVEGIADITPPVAEIKVKENKWTSFWNNLTFGLFFKETQDVTITVYDAGSGVKSVQYYLSGGELERDEVRSITGWSDYNGTFKINPDNKYVVYAMITDHAGNVTYINSEGMVLDATAPVIYGIEDGGIYHGDKVFKAMDENFLKIEVDGVDITNTTEGDDEFKIVADNAEHTATITDKAGNVTEYKITVYKKYMVTYTDGEGSSYEKNFNYGEVITIPNNEIFKDTFRKTGHTVKEWQGYTEGMTMPLMDLTFTAVYAPCEYTVTFEQNGGAVINPITVTFGEKYGNLPSSAITGLSGGNKNWYLVDTDGNVTETNIKNLTLVSTARDHKLFIKRNVLAPSVSVALTVPGGISDGYQYYIPGASKRVLTATVGNMNTDILEYTYRWYKDGTLIEGATSNVLTLDGNVSDSGTYKVEVTATLKDGANIVVGSDTATASKEQKVKILHATNTLSYDANGGEGGPQNSYTGGTSLSVSKDVPTRAHHDFIGWNTAPDGTADSYKAEDAYTFANDNGNGGCEVTLYAQWKLVEYTVTYKADGESVSTEKVGHGKDATLPAVPAKDGYVGKWDSDGKNITGDTTITAVYTAIPVVKPDEVKPEDKTDLEDVKAKLEEMLEDDSYTDDDKKDIQDAIDDAYNALTDYEKSLVDEDAKKALDDAKAALAELNKPADTDSPQTGDNSNMFLWIALLFVSGGAVITLTVADRKRRTASKR